MLASTALAAAALLASACDPGGITDSSGTPTVARVAYVAQENGRPALYVQNADGSGRSRVHFTGATEMPGNSGAVPPVRDENILALGPLAWSPDGRRLAVVVTLAYDQSELVLIDADGSNARVASFDFQIIMTAPDWSPDGTKLAYGMSTQPRGFGVQLFVTDLTANTWRQVTNADPIGSAGPDVRWNTDGGTIYCWRTIVSPTATTDWVSRISSVDVATGSQHVLADSVAGMVQDIARNGTWALVLRSVSQPPGQDGVRDLVRRPMIGLGPELKLAEGNLWWARASADDRGATVVADEDASPSSNSFAAWVVPIGGGKALSIAGLDKNAYMLDVTFQ